MLSVETTVIQVSLSLVVAVIAALVTVWLSLRRFYREKWWEAKMRAYSEIIEALHHMKRDLDISMRAEETGQDTDTEFYKTWDARHRAAWDQVRKHIDIGEFLFSPRSMAILKELADTENPDEGYYMYLETFARAVGKCCRQ